MKWILIFVGVCLSTLVAPSPHARLLEDDHDESCDDLSAERTVEARFLESLCHLTTNNVSKWVSLAQSPEQSDKDELQRQVRKLIGLGSGARAQSFVQLLTKVSRLDLTPDQRHDRVITIALRQLSLIGKIHRMPVSDPEAQRLRQSAGEALLREPAMVDLAQSLLDRALGLACVSMDKDNGSSCQHISTQLFRDMAWLAESELKFGKAARFYEFAASAQPLDNKGARYDLSMAAGLWIDHAEATGQLLAFENAARSYQRMLDLAVQADDPLLWAKAQINLGLALQKLGEFSVDIGKLQQSAEALRAGIDSIGESYSSLDEAILIARANLGVTLFLIGELGLDNNSFEQSITELRAALDDVSRGFRPHLWASLKNNLAISLLSLGQRTNDIRMLRDARDALRDTLSVWTRERAPRRWAVTQTNFGNALLEIGILSATNSALEKAVTAYRTALAELSQEHQPLDWATAQSNLGTALRTIGSGTNQPDFVQEAVNSFNFALEEIKKDQVPMEWSRTQYGLGLAQFELALSRGSIRDMEASISSLEAVLEVRDRASLPMARVKALDLLFEARAFVGIQKKDPQQLEQALAAIKEARDIHVIDAKMDDVEPRYVDLINGIESLIRKLKNHLKNDSDRHH